MNKHTDNIPSPMKWHGGKHYLANKIISYMPPRCQNPNAPAADDSGWLHYVEPFAGGLSVLFANNPEGISEVVNDINGDLTNFWSVLRDADLFDDFKRQIEAMPLSQHEWVHSNPEDQVPKPRANWSMVESAVAFFVRYRQSRQALGQDFATLSRNRTRRGMNEQVSAWLSAVDGLPAAHARLKRVVVLRDNALTVIRQQDGPRTLFYLDPPYLHETRISASAYQHECDDSFHWKLLELLAEVEGRFILSGYDSEMYREFETTYNWHRKEIKIDNKSSSKETKEIKTEVLWLNYDLDKKGPF